MVGKQDCAQTDPSAKYIVGKQSRRGKLTHYHCMKRFININLLLSSNTCQLGFALSSKIHFQNCAMLTKLYSYEFDNFMCIAICNLHGKCITKFQILWTIVNMKNEYCIFMFFFRKIMHWSNSSRQNSFHLWGAMHWMWNLF